MDDTMTQANPSSAKGPAKSTGTRRRGRPSAESKRLEAEFDELIGSTAPTAAVSEEDEGRVSTDVAEVYGGVSAYWLATMFGADKDTIKKKLAASGIEIVGRRHGAPLYRLSDAAPYLVKPKVDLVTYVKGLRPNDLPPMLNEAYWAAMLKRQKWEENARQLWHTDDVLEVFGDLAAAFKSTVQLWVEDLERLHGLTPEMRATVVLQTDRLLEQVYQVMVDAPKKRSTRSSFHEVGAHPDPEGGGSDAV